MEQTLLDSLALERLLSLAQELGIFLPITKEDDLLSLKVARCIQAHVSLQWWPRMAACMGFSDNTEELALQVHLPRDRRQVAMHQTLSRLMSLHESPLSSTSGLHTVIPYRVTARKQRTSAGNGWQWGAGQWNALAHHVVAAGSSFMVGFIQGFNLYLKLS
ncbi:unnamed protein product [Lampetra fluviatilis]